MPALSFANDTQPGITRRRKGEGWAYFAPSGKPVTDASEVARLDAIALPPAYENCWFSPDPDVHLLATGYDAKGRKQYRYHPEWREAREQAKFERCPAFGVALPKLRERVANDLGHRALDRDRAIASVIALLDTGEIRVGNECYAKANRSFGATTLRTRHAKVERGHVRLRFKGKSGREREIDCDDPRLVRCVRRMQDLPGQHLFQYLAPCGSPVPVHSHDVNDYLAETMGEGFTAKHFRTWAASTLAFACLWSDREASLTRLMEEVSEHLGNTPAVARRSYVHPAVIAAAKRDEGALPLPERLPRKTRWMAREERGLLAFLEVG